MKFNLILILVAIFTLTWCFWWDKKAKVDNIENQVIVWAEKVDELWIWKSWDSWIIEVKNWFSN